MTATRNAVTTIGSWEGDDVTVGQVEGALSELRRHEQRANRVARPPPPEHKTAGEESPAGAEQRNGAGWPAGEGEGRIVARDQEREGTECQTGRQ